MNLDSDIQTQTAQRCPEMAAATIAFTLPSAIPFRDENMLLGLQLLARVGLNGHAICKGKGKARGNCTDRALAGRGRATSNLGGSRVGVSSSGVAAASSLPPLL